jgi:hypothetical protein
MDVRSQDRGALLPRLPPPLLLTLPPLLREPLAILEEEEEDGRCGALLSAAETWKGRAAGGAIAGAMEPDMEGAVMFMLGETTLAAMAEARRMPSDFGSR